MSLSTKLFFQKLMALDNVVDGDWKIRIRLIRHYPRAAGQLQLTAVDHPKLVELIIWTMQSNYALLFDSFFIFFGYVLPPPFEKYHLAPRKTHILVSFEKSNHIG